MEGRAMTDNSPGYVIKGGADGRERLRLLSRIVRPTTLSLLDRVGVAPGSSCLDFGCGGGDVCVELSRLVGPGGRVLGIDMDAETIAIAERERAANALSNIRFEVATIGEWPSRRQFDLIYGRFILTHLPDPAAAVSTCRGSLRPGGQVVFEDIDFAGHFIYPPSAAFERYIGLYSEVVHLAGADPKIGPRVPALLIDAGFEDVQVNVVQPAGLAGEVKAIHHLTMEYIRTPVLAHGLASAEEIDGVVEELRALADQPLTLMSLPRIVQTWGRVPLG
jgi:SAM-dependent methyltransferase